VVTSPTTADSSS